MLLEFIFWVSGAFGTMGLTHYTCLCGRRGVVERAGDSASLYDIWDGKFGADVCLDIA